MGDISPACASSAGTTGSFRKSGKFLHSLADLTEEAGSTEFGALSLTRGGLAMKRRVWLSLALLGAACVAAPVGAQESRIMPPSSSKPVEPGAKPTVIQEKTELPAAGASGFSTSEGVVSDEYRPTFNERVMGLRDVVFRPFNFDWFNDFANSSNMMTSDIEDPYWLRFEMLFGWMKQAKTPPMLTTSTPQSSLGIIGNEGTSVLFGGNVDVGAHFGGKVTGGFWLEPTQSLGFEASYSFLAKTGYNRTEASQGSPLLALPFFDVVANQQNAYPIAHEAIPDLDLDQLSGKIAISLQSFYQGAEFNALYNVSRGPRSRLDWFWGYRFANFNEKLLSNFFQEEAAVPPATTGTQRLVQDAFTATNYFNGINWGLRSEWYRGCWSFNAAGSLALGINSSRLDINGNTQSASPPNFQIITTSGGIYALDSNIGVYRKNSFSVIPEVQFGVGYYCSDSLHLYCNYNFMAFTNVVRPGEQVDNRINPNILDGNAGNPANPTPLNNTSTFWLQTLSFGLEYRY